MNYIYKFENFNNEIIYIGKTVNLKRRIRQHFMYGHLDKNCYSHVSRIFFCLINGKTNNEIMETYLINKYHPIYNTDKNFPENIRYHNDKHVMQKEPEWKELYFDFYDDDIILSDSIIKPKYCDQSLNDKEKCIALLKQNIGRMKFSEGLYEKYIHSIDIHNLLEYFTIIHREIMENIDYNDSNIDEPVNFEESLDYVAFNINTIHTINIKYLMLLSQMHLIIHLFGDIYGIVIHNHWSLKSIPTIF